MWIDTRYIVKEDALKYFNKFREFSDAESRVNMARITEVDLGRRAALFNGREGIHDFFVAMNYFGVEDDVSAKKGETLVHIAITDVDLIPELESGELLDRLKDYLSVKIGLQEVAV
ncbi:hypothetical protein HYV88_04875 [Candidatus Woesearchaeota archaeon]|nr:hypothetical protein [Candidatus Woesearchaeota archaeon]